MKEIIKELQDIADKHDSLKKEVELLLEEGKNIKDKLQDYERVMSISESISNIFKEMEDIENQYYNKLENSKK